MPLALLVLLAFPARAAELRARVSDAEGRPVAEAVVFVTRLKGEAMPAPKEPTLMDQVDQEFSPHLLAIQAGGLVRFPNKDDIHHHIYSFSPARKFELPLYKGEAARPVDFPKPGVVKLGCNIHDWMSGVVFVAPTRHFAVTDEGGEARLAGLPEGELELAVFHERLKGSSDATRRKLELGGKGGESAWTVTLKAATKRRRPGGYR